MKYEMTRTDAAPDREALTEALAEAREAHRLDPTYAPALCVLGFVLERVGERADSQAALWEAVRLARHDWRTRFVCAYCTWGRDRENEARETLRYFPEFPLARVLIATVCVPRGLFDDAEREIDAGIASLPRRSGASEKYSIVALYYLKGLLCARRDAYDDAFRALECERALESLGHLYSRECVANAWYVIGAIHLRLGDKDAARAAFEEARARVAQHPMARAGLAILDGRFAEAAALAASGIALSVDHAVALAAVLVHAGDVAAAAALVLRALEAAPPGSAGWTIPIDPLLRVKDAPDVWRDVLGLLRERAS